jgi:hypothetical protein
MAADSTAEPVVLEGTGELVTDTESLAGYLAKVNDKYGVEYDLTMIDPEVQATFRITPRSVFGMREEEFSESPTRWIFGTRLFAGWPERVPPRWTGPVGCLG